MGRLVTPQLASSDGVEDPPEPLPVLPPRPVPAPPRPPMPVAMLPPLPVPVPVRVPLPAPGLKVQAARLPAVARTMSELRLRIARPSGVRVVHVIYVPPHAR